MNVKRHSAGPRMSGAVVHGNTVYLAGQVADGANVKAQTEAVLKKIDDLLAAAGSSKANLLSTVIYLADIRDRKSTRLNSSHGSISYAVFCLKKKTRQQYIRSQ